MDLNLDVEVSNRPHVVADLHQIPLRDESVDTILSVAVLEHTRRAWEVTAEFLRVLRPGGHAVVAIPFLQPQHACPHDYVRFTEAGLRELMLSAGFEVIQTAPVHHFGQTLAWLLWEYYKENPPSRWLRPGLGWLLRQMSLGRIFRGRCQNAHNTFYVVGRKPGQWCEQVLPDPELPGWFHELLVCPRSRRPLHLREGELRTSDDQIRYRLSDGSAHLLEPI